jgi:hypothetical protein
LIPAGSKILELEDLKLQPFDPVALSYKWEHPDPGMDELCADLQKLISRGDRLHMNRQQLFAMIWERAFGESGDFRESSCCSPVPHLTEAWYCCAEPVPTQEEDAPEEDSFSLV